MSSLEDRIRQENEARKAEMRAKALEEEEEEKESAKTFKVFKHYWDIFRNSGLADRARELIESLKASSESPNAGFYFEKVDKSPYCLGFEIHASFYNGFGMHNPYHTCRYVYFSPHQKGNFVFFHTPYDGLIRGTPKELIIRMMGDSRAIKIDPNKIGKDYLEKCLEWTAHQRFFIPEPGFFCRVHRFNGFDSRFIATQSIGW